MIVSVAAFILDCLIGDPRSKFHPVVLIGNLIAWLEKRFYRAEDSNMTKFSMGFLPMLVQLSPASTSLCMIHLCILP